MWVQFEIVDVTCSHSVKFQTHQYDLRERFSDRKQILEVRWHLPVGPTEKGLGSSTQDKQFGIKQDFPIRQTSIIK